MVTSYFFTYKLLPLVRILVKLIFSCWLGFRSTFDVNIKRIFSKHDIKIVHHINAGSVNIPIIIILINVFAFCSGKILFLILKICQHIARDILKSTGLRVDVYQAAATV